MCGQQQSLQPHQPQWLPFGPSDLAAGVPEQVSQQQMVQLLLEAELLALAWAQVSSEVPGWPEGLCGRSGFGFHAASQLRDGSASTK